jgi:hypothetical protein
MKTAVSKKIKTKQIIIPGNVAQIKGEIEEN